jgi:hypothetical protein
MTYIWDPQLSDREVHFIGMISVQWASLEHVIFTQTLDTFVAEGKTASELPKEMNNIQFTGVLELWNTRVAEQARGQRKKVLLEQYRAVVELKPTRDALAHGMWHWSAEDLGAISTVRVKKREIITSHFSADALENIARKVGGINFALRFPGGTVDLAKARMQEGGYISRRAMALFAGVPFDRVDKATDQPSKAPPSREKPDA